MLLTSWYWTEVLLPLRPLWSRRKLLARDSPFPFAWLSPWQQSAVGPAEDTSWRRQYSGVQVAQARVVPWSRATCSPELLAADCYVKKKGTSRAAVSLSIWAFPLIQNAKSVSSDVVMHTWYISRVTTKRIECIISGIKISIPLFCHKGQESSRSKGKVGQIAQGKIIETSPEM